MPAYIIVQVDISDPQQYEAYKKLTPDTVKAFGGKFVLRGNPVEALEGSWDHDRLVMLEFADKKLQENGIILRNIKLLRKLGNLLHRQNFFLWKVEFLAFLLV